MIPALVGRKKNIKTVMAVSSKMLLIEAAIAVIMDEQKRLLITQRAPHLSKGGYWEFPGGKLDRHESPELALIREVREEVGLDVVRYYYLGEVHHSYDTYQLILHGYVVHQYRGEARCCESQTGIRWISLDELQAYDFPEANRQFIEKLHDRHFLIESGI